LRRFSVKVGAKERIVELDLGDDGRLHVVVDGVEKDVVLEKVEAGAWVVRQGKAQSLAYVDGENGKITVGLKRGGDDVVLVAAEVTEARSAQVAALAQRARGAAAEGPLTVKSPMPGRLVKVLVKVGDKIAAGQSVVVVEAMKMENELRAPRAGVVRELRGAEGAAVDAGQDLVVIDPAPSGG
jgi:biotin carboxyl carrier protein